MKFTERDTLPTLPPLTNLTMLVPTAKTSFLERSASLHTISHHYAMSIQHLVNIYFM